MDHAPEPDEKARLKGAHPGPAAPRRRALRATWLLCGVNLVVYAVTAWQSRSWQPSSELLAQGWNEHALIAVGQTWRLLSACFLHAGLLHLTMNLWVLLQIGTLVEVLVGARLMFTAYLVTGLAGSWLSFRLGHGPSVGASGAVLGLAGLALALGRLHRHRLAPPLAAALGRSMLVWVLSVLAIGAVLPRVDNYSHLGGLLAGLLLGPLAALQDGAPRPVWRRWLEGALAVAGLCLTVFVGWQAYAANRGDAPLQPQRVETLGLTISLPAGWVTRPTAQGGAEAQRLGLPAKLVLERIPVPQSLSLPEQQRWIARRLAGVRTLDGPRRVTLASGVTVWYARFQPRDVNVWYAWFGDDAVLELVGVMLAERVRTYGPLFSRIADSLKVDG